MTRFKSAIENRLKSGEIYKPWTWPGILMKNMTRPIAPGVYIMNIIFQRIFGINGTQKFMVHYTSYVAGNIIFGKNVWVSFATSGGCYIQGGNGVKIGDDTIFAPGVKIISANHNFENYNQKQEGKPIIIGKNCWLSANSVILPEVELGDNVIVGAGAVVTKSFPANCIVAGVPAKIIKHNHNNNKEYV